MGIYHFFSWFRKNFGTCISTIKSGKIISESVIEVDNLLIDMNGLFHNSAQKIYEYGTHKRNSRFIKPKTINKTQIDVFKDVCESIEELLKTVNPKKRIIMAVDGPAPACKMYQQRQRRYKSVLNREEDDKSFDSNAISPGTKFMDYLGKYVDFYIKKKMSEDVRWQKLEIIFSNEKVPGEGEQKLFSYVRKYGNKKDSWLLYGSDADLIMLALTTRIEKFFILRDNVDYNKDPEDAFYCINIGDTTLQLQAMMDVDGAEDTKGVRSPIDFVFLCFILGNDFVPHLPGLEIIEGGIDTILSVYRDVVKFHGNITNTDSNGKIYFNKVPLKVFLQIISEYEKPVLEHKLKNKKIYFEDTLLEACATFSENSYNLDIELYRKEYCKKYFGSNKPAIIEKVCHSYLEGLQFVISYYTDDVPNWNWNYKYHYAPSPYFLAQYIDSFVFRIEERNTPLLPFQQLLYILPPKSFNLLPSPLDLLHKESELEEYFPDTVEIDLSGKKNDYQGIALLPFVNIDKIKKVHGDNAYLIDVREGTRNKHGKTFRYKYEAGFVPELKKFYYGTITNYKIRTSLINV